MKAYKVIPRFSVLSIERQMKNAVFYVVLLVTLFVVQIVCYGVGDYLYETSDKMNIFEIYIWMMSSRGSQLLYLLGLLFCVYGCEFFRNSAPYFMIRMNRKIWIISNVLYLLLIVLGYNIYLIFCLGVACKGAVTISGVWSDAAHVAGQIWVEEIGIRAIMGVNYHMLSYNPNIIGLLSVALSVCIGLFVGMFLLLFMLIQKPVWGISGVCLFWFLDMLLIGRWGVTILQNFSPFAMSRVGNIGLWSAGSSLVHTFTYFVIILFVMSVLLKKVVRQMDFLKME